MQPFFKNGTEREDRSSTQNGTERNDFKKVGMCPALGTGCPNKHGNLLTNSIRLSYELALY